MADICNNCGKYGHQSLQCIYPITSYGIILFRWFNGEYQYLMVRRKNTFAYIDFVYGNYLPNNAIQLQKNFDEMTIHEHNIIKTGLFQTCWSHCWDSKKMDTQLEDKFNKIRPNIAAFIDNSTKKWIEPEWEFPKGRKNSGELDLNCAIREFNEETGFNINNIVHIENILPFEETYFGSNFKAYKTKYYLYKYVGSNGENMDGFQESEISKMEWKNIYECMNSIRYYHTEKKTLIDNVHKTLLEFHTILG